MASLGPLVQSLRNCNQSVDLRFMVLPENSTGEGSAFKLTTQLLNELFTQGQLD